MAIVTGMRGTTARLACVVLLTVGTACGDGLHPCVSWPTRELARCGTVTVPENSAVTGGRMIPLRVMVLRGRRSPHDADPVFVLTGGPGMAATDLAAHATSVLGDLRASRDIVLVDVRGTGASARLDCDLYEDAGRDQPFIAPMFPLDPVRRCAARLSARADLRRYTTSIIADDLDVVRRALGYAQVNLFGVSYGSRLALAYMRQYPAVVRSAVLQGVSPPEAPTAAAASWAGQRALEHAFAECARDAACIAASPDPRADVGRLFERLRLPPVQVRLWNWRRLSFETVTLTARGVAERLWTASYDPAAIARELPFVHLAAQGRYEELARRLVRQGRQRRARRSEGMMLSVLCAEDAPRLTGVDTSSALLGAPIVAELVRACSVWPRGVVSPEFSQPVHSDIPTLLLSGALDPVTPPELAASAQRSLTRARSYVDPAGGHGTLDARARALVADFVRRPGADTRVTDDVIGTWSGTAIFRGQPLAMTVRFERQKGILRGAISAPDVALLEQPLSDVTRDSSRLFFSLADADGALAFRGRQVGDTLAGTASLAGSAVVLEGASGMTWRFVRGTAPAPAPYTTRELTIAAKGAMLAATLLVPHGVRASGPAVLILQGSSTNLRADYRFYADHFARAGFVVLTFDKRGNGESTGDYRRASYDDLVLDARAAYDTLAAQPAVDARRIGLWGLSQGAFLAPRVTEHLVTPPAFVVAVSSPGVPISEAAAYQDSLRVAWRGFAAPAAARAAAAHRTLASALWSHASADSIATLFAAIANEPWRRYTSMPRTVPAAAELRGWYWYGRTLDPAAWWRRLRVPVLLVYGEGDDLVPAKASADRLARVLRDAGNRDVTVRTFPGANHVLKLVASPLAPPEAVWAWPIVVPGYLDETVAWMRTHSARP